jgi:hypothetical protein
MVPNISRVRVECRYICTKRNACPANWAPTAVADPETLEIDAEAFPPTSLVR